MSSLANGGSLVRGDAIAAKRIAAGAAVVCALFAIYIIADAGNCSAWFAAPALCRLPQAPVFAIAVAALPLLAFVVCRSPLAAFLALYIVLVPIDDALLVGQGLTVTKMLGFAVALIALGRIVRRRAEIALPHAVFGWAAVLALMAVSFLWSIDPGLSSGFFSTIASAFALLLVVVAVPMDDFEHRSIIYATVFSGAVVGVVGLIFAHQEVSTLQGQIGRLYLNLGSVTLDPNRFAAALLLPSAMAVGLAAHVRGWQRVGVLALLALTFTAIYLSASRAAVLSLIAMAIVGILGSKRRLLLGSLLGASVGLLLATPNEISWRVFHDPTALSGAGRFDIWKVGLEIFRGHWLLGTGVGTFQPAFNRVFFLVYEPRAAFGRWAGWSRDPHSLLLSTASELGLLGLAVMTLALVQQYRSTRLIGPDHPYAWLRTTLRAAFIGLIVAAFSVDVLGTKFAWLLFTEMLVFARIAAGPSLRAPAQPFAPRK